MLAVVFIMKKAVIFFVITLLLNVCFFYLIGLVLIEVVLNTVITLYYKHGLNVIFIFIAFILITVFCYYKLPKLIKWCLSDD